MRTMKYTASREATIGDAQEVCKAPLTGRLDTGLANGLGSAEKSAGVSPALMLPLTKLYCLWMLPETLVRHSKMMLLTASYHSCTARRSTATHLNSEH